MAERFPNNPYEQGIERAPRMSFFDRMKQNMKNRVMEPIGGLFGNMVRDNIYATGRAFEKVWNYEKDEFAKDPDQHISVPGKSWRHFSNAFQRTMGAVFAPASQLFGSGVGEVINLKPQDAGARTVVGVGASFMFARDALIETASIVTTPIKAALEISSSWVSDVFDNTVIGATRFFTGGLFGKKADSPLYEVQPTPPRMHSPFMRAAHRNPYISNAEAHKNRDLQAIAHRDNYEEAVYNAAYRPPHGAPEDIPSKNVIDFASARSNRSTPLPSQQVETGMRMAA